MSRVSRMIEVSAPYMRVDRESLTLHGLTCGYCQGNGYFWGRDDIGRSKKDPCPICKGKGVVDAEVTIRYRAADAEHRHTEQKDKPFTEQTDKTFTEQTDKPFKD